MKIQLQKQNEQLNLGLFVDVTAPVTPTGVNSSARKRNTAFKSQWKMNQ